MSHALDPREVLSYLNDLGYQNITATRFKDFMRDLKKLIKKQKQLERENVPPPPVSYQCNTLGHTLLAPTESSKAKQVAKKENVVSVQIKRAVHACHTHYPKHSSTTDKSESQVSGLQQIINSHVSETTNTDNVDLETIASASPKRPKSCEAAPQKTRTRVKFKGHALKPKASYIVPRIPVKTCKSDPVALYHKYQEEWKKQKVPGEDNHSDLRWAIRERMLGQPHTMSAAPSMEVIARKRRTSSRI